MSALEAKPAAELYGTALPVPQENPLLNFRLLFLAPGPQTGSLTGTPAASSLQERRDGPQPAGKRSLTASEYSWGETQHLGRSPVRLNHADS